jgi:hypothetical protein
LSSKGSTPSGVEDLVVPGAEHLGDLDVVVVLEVRDAPRLRRVDQVDVAALDRGDLRGGLDDDPEGDLLDGRHPGDLVVALEPVVLVALHPPQFVVPVLDELVRTGPDGLLGEVDAAVLAGRRRDDRHRREVRLEGRVRTVGRQFDRVVVDDLRTAVPVVHVDFVRRALVPLQREHDVLGGQLVAVVELDALSQGEAVGGLVEALVLLGENVVELPLPVGRDEGLVDVHRRLHRRRVGLLDGVVLSDVRPEGPDELPAFGDVVDGAVGVVRVHQTGRVQIDAVVPVAAATAVTAVAVAAVAAVATVATATGAAGETCGPGATEKAQNLSAAHATVWSVTGLLSHVKRTQ